MSLGLKLAMKASGIKAPKLSGPGKLVDTSNVQVISSDRLCVPCRLLKHIVQGTCQNFGTAVMALVVLLVRVLLLVYTLS